MKRLLIAALLLGLLFSLGSCEYDKTSSIRALVSAPFSYRGVLKTEKGAQKIQLEFSESGEMTLHYLDGPLAGLTKICDGTTERQRLDEFEFPVSVPSELALIRAVFVQLSYRQYLYEKPSEQETELSFHFCEDNAEYTIITDAQASTLLAVFIHTSQETLELHFTREASYEPSPSHPQNLGGDPPLPPKT